MTAQDDEDRCYSVTKWCPTLCDPMDCSTQASLSITNSQSLLKLMSIELEVHPTISSSVIPFSSGLQSFQASRSLPVRWLFTSGGQSIRASASASVLPMNIQGWFPLGWTILILLSKGLSRVFSSNIETCIQQVIPFTFYKVNLIPKSAKKSEKGQPDLICTSQLGSGWCKLPFPVPIWQTSKGRLGMLKDCMDTAAEQGVQSSWSLVPLLRDARPWGDDV